jgi:hypothetical protein
MTDTVYELREGMPEPLSRRALRHLRTFHATEDDAKLDFPHMQSPSLKRIVYELLRYCHGEIDGISVLVAGQRGAGKTTLAKLAIQDVMAKSKGLIPLPLLLHGPTIIAPLAREPDRQKEANGTPVTIAAGPNGAPLVIINTAAAADPASQAVAQTNGHADEDDAGDAGDEDDQSAKVDLKERALRQIVTALYRSLSLQIYEAWLNAAREAPERRRTERELLALRAHLDLRLEQRVPDPDVLRKVWERAGFLHCGVAFYLRPVEKDDVTGQMWRDTRPPAIAGLESDQGIREIVALSTCADAYRVIISQTEEQLGRKQESEFSRELKLSLQQAEKKKEKEEEPKGKSAAEKATPPVLGTAAGSLALAATAWGSGSLDGVLVGAGAALLVWFGSWVAMNYGTRKSRQETRRELTMKINWNIDRLERDLPLLIKRVKDAGFAPIFVLDELDKADDAFGVLHRFLTLTKHIVTDQSAFMFLTNRDYYEKLNSAEQQQPSNGRSGA